MDHFAMLTPREQLVENVSASVSQLFIADLWISQWTTRNSTLRITGLNQRDRFGSNTKKYLPFKYQDDVRKMMPSFYMIASQSSLHFF